MNLMTTAPLFPAAPSSLPPLGGRLLIAYRIAFALLLAASLAVVVLTWLPAAMPTAIWILRLIKTVVLVAVSATLIRRRGRDPVAAMLSLSFLLWTISSSVDFAGAQDMAWPALLDRCRFLLFALALLLFPDGRWSPRWTRFAAVLIVAVFVLGVAEVLRLVPTTLFLPLAIGCVLVAIAALLSRYRRASATHRQQLKWVAFGLIAGVSLILAARGLAALTDQREMPAAGALSLEAMFQLGIMVIAIGFLISLLRYRLYDAEHVISRSAVYAGLTLALVSTFAACEALVELISQTYLGSGIGNVSGAVAAAIAAVLLSPLHGKISDWAEQYFQRDLATLKRQLPELLAAQSTGSSLRRLAAAVLPRLAEAVQSSRLAVIVDGKLAAAHGVSDAAARRIVRDWPSREQARLRDRADGDPFPLRIPLKCPFGQVRGWLLLGPRPDGSLPGKDERATLAALTPFLQRAILAVAERQSDADRQRRRLAKLQAAVARLASQVAAMKSQSQRRENGGRGKD